MSSNANNPCGLYGIDFIEFVSPEPEKLDALFKAFGFSRTLHHGSRPVDLYRQGDITLLVNRDTDGFAARFGKLHGPSICSMGWRVAESAAALSAATARGGTADTGDHQEDGRSLPAIRALFRSVERKQEQRGVFDPP